MNWRITDCISKKQGSRVAPSPSGKWYWLAGICLLFVVVIGGVLWYAHPQPLEKVIPVLTQENMNCDVSLYCGDTEGEYKGTLTKAQLETLLTYFDGETLKRSIFKKMDAATEQRSTVSDGTTRLYFWQNNTNERYELLLLRDCVIVGDLSHNQRETYSFSGGQTKQDDLFWYLYTILVPESKKQTITSIHMDFDGDGDNDVVKVCATPYLRQSEDSTWVWDESLYHYTLEWERDGQFVAKTALDGGNGSVYTTNPTIFMTQDQQGNPLVVAGLPTISSGGAGNLEVYVMGWEHESPIQREVPTYTVQGTLDGTTAQVFVPETGNAEQLDLNWWLKEKNRQIVQDESGAMVWPAAPSQADGICAVTQAVQGIRMAQYVWGIAHTDGMGWLITYLTWNNGKPVVVDQYFSWQSETAEEAMSE